MQQLMQRVTPLYIYYHAPSAVAMTVLSGLTITQCVVTTNKASVHI